MEEYPILMMLLVMGFGGMAIEFFIGRTYDSRYEYTKKNINASYQR